MKKSEIEKITQIAESSDWSLTVDNNEYAFNTYSPQGQDFNIEIMADTVDELIEKLYERYNNFDCSEETYLWLDESGHGINGAPYDIKDLYEDMENCKILIFDLYHSLKSHDITNGGFNR